MRWVARSMLADQSTLTRDGASDLLSRFLKYVKSTRAMATISGATFGSTEFANNQITSGDDNEYVLLGITSIYGKKSATVYSNDAGDSALAAAAAKADEMAQRESVQAPDEVPSPGHPAAENLALWHDESVQNCDPAKRFGIVRDAIELIDNAGLVGAGSLGISARTVAVMSKDGHFEFGRTSTGTYSLTARTKDGTGSGWAGWQGEDWSKADPKHIAQQAVDLAKRTQNPVAIEPGRYTVVMSAAALGSLIWMLGRYGLKRDDADDGLGPFARNGGGTKIGLQVFDERVTLEANPADPEGGFLPFVFHDGEIFQFDKVDWVRNGVLRHLAEEGVRSPNQQSFANSYAMQMTGGPTSLDEMIASTSRGIFISRFTNISIQVFQSFLLSGVTRDGTFLIEGGKVTKPIKNLRFVESPFSFLNNLLALGPAQRVPVGGAPIVVPCAKIRDFSFTSLSDAV